MDLQLFVSLLASSRTSHETHSIVDGSMPAERVKPRTQVAPRSFGPSWIRRTFKLLSLLQ